MSFVRGGKGMKGGEVGEHHRLKATLSWPHLIALGVGAIVGTGIYTLIGVGAGLAGPGVMLSFAIAGAVCACAALAYAEMATMIPAAGSAYTYSYSVLGEGLAWIVGWSLILEYTVVCGAVAAGWAGHAAEFVTIPGMTQRQIAQNTAMWIEGDGDFDGTIRPVFDSSGEESGERTESRIYVIDRATGDVRQVVTQLAAGGTP